MKPEAPAEVRGSYRPIASNLPGLDVCELCPEQARVMDKCTVIRSFSHGSSDHWAAAHWMLTGRLGANGSDRVPRQPSMGAVAIGAGNTSAVSRNSRPAGINWPFVFQSLAVMGIPANYSTITSFIIPYFAQASPGQKSACASFRHGQQLSALNF